MTAQFDMVSSEIINTIKESVEVQRFIPETPTELFSEKLHFAPERLLAEGIGVASLTGLIDFLNEEIDKAAVADAFVQVASPTQVFVKNALIDRFDRRFVPVTATFAAPDIGLLKGNHVSHEQAITELQACFGATDEQKNLIRILGNVVKNASIGREDDGVTQLLTTRTGVKTKEERIVNPVMLAPFRTFAEIVQPESPFIVRMDDDFDVSLHCADGGEWKNTARVAIKDYLVSKLTVDVAVLA